jgi:hypothetical protein
VSGNPKESKWSATLQADRKRKMIALTLSDVARAKLAQIAKRRKLSKSALVEALILEATTRPHYPCDDFGPCDIDPGGYEMIPKEEDLRNCAAALRDIADEIELGRWGNLTIMIDYHLVDKPRRAGDIASGKVLVGKSLRLDVDTPTRGPV